MTEIWRILLKILFNEIGTVKLSPNTGRSKSETTFVLIDCNEYGNSAARR